MLNDVLQCPCPKTDGLPDHNKASKAIRFPGILQPERFHFSYGKPNIHSASRDAPISADFRQEERVFPFPIGRSNLHHSVFYIINYLPKLKPQHQAVNELSIFLSYSAHTESYIHHIF